MNLSKKEPIKSAIQTVEDAEQEVPIFDNDEIRQMHFHILENIKNDSENLDTVINYFHEVVVDNGDASNSSKEALVNLIKIKTDLNDQMTKIYSEMLKTKNKSVKINASQKNYIYASTKELLQELENEKNI